LGVEPVASNIEPGDSPIARIPGGNKLRAVIIGHSTRGAVSTGVGSDFVAFQSRSQLNSSTNSSTNAFYASSVKRKCLVINDARVAKLADAPDLGSGGAILRGSSPLPGTPMPVLLRLRNDPNVRLRFFPTLGIAFFRLFV
jgi:hypothetical protein